MKKLSVGGLALALLVLASENTAAQEQKMTCEEYMAQGNELVNREAAANTQIEELNAQLEGLNMQIAQLDQANLDLNARILEAVGPLRIRQSWPLGANSTLLSPSSKV